MLPQPLYEALSLAKKDGNLEKLKGEKHIKKEEIFKIQNYSTIR